MEEAFGGIEIGEREGTLAVAQFHKGRVWLMDLNQSELWAMRAKEDLIKKLLAKRGDGEARVIQVEGLPKIFTVNTEL